SVIRLGAARVLPPRLSVELNLAISRLSHSHAASSGSISCLQHGPTELLNRWIAIEFIAKFPVLLPPLLPITPLLASKPRRQATAGPHEPPAWRRPLRTARQAFRRSRNPAR